MMPPDKQWERLQKIFLAAVDLPETERQSFLLQECGSDFEMATEIRSMLQADAARALPVDGDLRDMAGMLEDDGDGFPDDRVFGPYSMVRPLGEGGTGKVYLARRSDVGLLVAIKFLRDAWISSQRRDRFAAEQRTLAQLSHPLIASLYDAGVTKDGTPYFVMEYVKGVALTQYCTDHSCTLAQRLEIFLKVCEAIRYLHSQATMHLDIKPSNILVSEGGLVKLLDFGIAKQMEAAGESVLTRQTGFRMMTAAYASPEQWQGKRPGLQADIYSLGVVLYELLTGTLPYDLTKSGPAEVDRLITQQEPMRPSAQRQRSSQAAAVVSARKSEWADLDVTCLKAMQKEPERRYATVDGLMQDVRAFLDGRALSARGDGWQYRAGKIVRRNSKAAIALATVLVLLAGLTGVFIWRVDQERQAALSEAAHANQLLQFTLNLFRGGKNDAGPPSELRVKDVLERGAQQARALQGDPLRQAEMFMTLGAVFQSMSDLGRAEENTKAAWVIRRQHLGGTAALAAQSEIALGWVHSDQGRLEEAEKEVREGIATLEHLKGIHDPDVLKGKVALGEILITRGADKAAIQFLEPVVRTQQAVGSSDVDRAQGLFQLGTAYFFAGDYNRAIQSTNSSLVLERALHGPVHPSIASGEQWLCQILRDENSLADAERHCRAALSIGEAWYGSDSPVTASSMRALGTVLAKENKCEEARPLLERALSIAQATYGELSDGVAVAIASLAMNDYCSSNWEIADQHYSRSLEIFRKVYGGDHHPNVALVLFRLAEVAGKERDYSRAEGLSRQALAVFVEVQGPEGVKTAMAHTQLGHILWYEKKYAEARQESQLGFRLLVNQPSPASELLEMTKKDLAEEDKILSSNLLNAH